MSESGQQRLFLLELQVEHPYDLALGPGRHELRDLGVRVDFDGETVTAAWLGHGPTAFLLPGVRQLRVGEPARVQDGDRLAWAGRSFAFVRHELAGDDRAPPRGVCKNANAAGHPLPALLLCVQGPERGNFYRVRSQPCEFGPLAYVRGVPAASADRSGVAQASGGAATPGPAKADVQVRGAALSLDGGPMRPADVWQTLAEGGVVDVFAQGDLHTRACLVRLGDDSV